MCRIPIVWLHWIMKVARKKYNKFFHGTLAWPTQVDSWSLARAEKKQSKKNSLTALTLLACILTKIMMFNYLIYLQFSWRKGCMSSTVHG